MIKIRPMTTKVKRVHLYDVAAMKMIRISILSSKKKCLIIKLRYQTVFNFFYCHFIQHNSRFVLYAHIRIINALNVNTHNVNTL